ncbi:Rne/Rng family ribonuclease [Rhodococcus sp. IEGM 1408]|uniref:Rne/Rng family ribonuclease n=1 Tax=Rhodococcus sp. IEGM 1408 TaxID=3082220 RepID=UPI002952B700|nr:Rne/Rng family ribonuclease [Rhodococcus sp. IEGM 1408]MDV8000708.1 Rne/Rng family ribonuclease [Rhodococcus sp. IEGM 1408]
MSDSNLTIDDLNALPEKMRAHAAAKAVGMTSKEFLTAMAGIGVEVRSAQSSVPRAVLLTWFANSTSSSSDAGSSDGGGSGADGPAAVAPVVVEDAPSADASVAVEDAPAEKPTRRAPAKKAPAKKAAAKKAAAEQVPAEQVPAEQAAAKQAPAKKATARKASSAKAAPAGSDAPVRRPLPEMSIVTGEVGTAEPGNHRRRSTATPSFSPLFLSPDEAAAKTAQERSTRSRSTEPETARTETARTDSTRSGSSPTGRGQSGRDQSEDTGVEAADETESQDDVDITDEQNDAGDGSARRRRRGRRGRGRGRGENFDEQDTENAGDTENAQNKDNENGSEDDDGAGDTDAADETSSSSVRDDVSDSFDSSTADDADGQGDSGDDSSEDDSDGSDGSPSGSRRRRRRRRRGGASGSDDNQASGDDAPQAEVSDQESRRRPARGGQSAGSGSGSGASTSTSADEVQGITSSTRLEAKRQRRRDGREAGRRRQPILSESEFLARRESVDRVMVVREKQRADGDGVMTQVGVIEDKVLVEHFVTTESARSMVGNVFLGRVQNVLPSMEAAFVDIGRGRNGVLYAGEVNWEAAGLGGKARRIEQALKPGTMVLVQVTKDPIGQKGARLTTQISLAGRFLVYVPDGNSTGISRKLPDTERRRLKAILKDVVPEGSGVIIRTAAEGVSEEEIGRDVERLAAQWTEISEAAAKRTSSGAGTPVALYEEPDLLVKVVRDLFNEDFTKLVIQGETSWNIVRDYVSRVAPEMTERLERYENPDLDVFATYRVDEQLAKALDRKVWLPSGGSLVIDRTEAMTVVDVNTGKYTGSGGNLEETVTKNNLEAAEEVVRQLRLRDVGGMVVIDFIDMVLEGNRDLVLRRLTEALGRDRTRHQVSEVTSLGLVQLTRKKLGTGLIEAFSTPCEHCQGRGLIVHSDPVHTESHNADEAGARKGRRRGGKGSDGSCSGQSESSSPSVSAPRQTPRKDGPAPAAHPAALAISRQEADQAAADAAAAADVKAGANAKAAVDAKASAASAAAAAKAKAPAAVEASPAAETPVSSGATTGSTESTGATESAATAEDASSSDAAGTRPSRRRRRSTRRPADGAAVPAVTTADESTVAAGTAGATGAAEATESPAAEAEVVAAASEAVQAMSTQEPVVEVAPVVATAPAEPEPEAEPAAQTGSSGRRPRRRSTRREAGSAAPAVAEQESTAVAAATVETAPVEATSVEAAPLAEVPPVVVAEPRKRPARRRATRSTTAPAGTEQ